MNVATGTHEFAWSLLYEYGVRPYVCRSDAPDTAAYELGFFFGQQPPVGEYSLYTPHAI
jgi:hypothetical protein